MAGILADILGEETQNEEVNTENNNELDGVINELENELQSNNKPSNNSNNHNEIDEIKEYINKLAEQNKQLMDELNRVKQGTEENTNDRVRNYLEKEWNDVVSKIVTPELEGRIDVKEAQKYYQDVAVKEGRYISPEEAMKITAFNKIFPDFSKMARKEKANRTFLEGFEANFKPSIERPKEIKNYEDALQASMAILDGDD